MPSCSTPSLSVHFTFIITSSFEPLDDCRNWIEAIIRMNTAKIANKPAGVGVPSLNNLGIEEVEIPLSCISFRI